MGASSSSSRRRPRVDGESLKARILEVFSVRAKREGLRSVMMADLARELRISASTLYRFYPSKEALALACVERWAQELAASEAAERRAPDPFERFMHWVDAWADENAALSPAFARDLRSDYPSAWERYREAIRQRKRRGAELLRPALKPGIDERVAFAILEMLLERVLRPDFADRLRISRHEAIRSAVAIWAGGAVDRRGRLHALESATEGKSP